MTALALAGAGRGGVAPDLILPPGFDRIGEVVRFEQDEAPPPAPKVGRPSREKHAARWAMGGVDVTPCTRCGLRGHVAGDPDRCLFYRGSFGLGGQAAQTEKSRP